MARQAVLILLIVIIFGVLVPWYKGFAFVDPRVMLAYACISILFVAPASAEAAASRERGGPAGEVLIRLALLVLWGWGISAAILVTGMVTLNAAYWRGTIIYPSWALFGSVLLFGLTGSAMVAALSGVLAQRFTANGVKGILRIAFLLILLAFVFSSRLPDQWQIAILEHSTRRAITSFAWQGSAVCAVACVILTVLLLRMNRAASV